MNYGLEHQGRVIFCKGAPDVLALLVLLPEAGALVPFMATGPKAAAHVEGQVPISTVMVAPLSPADEAFGPRIPFDRSLFNGKPGRKRRTTAGQTTGSTRPPALAPPNPTRPAAKRALRGSKSASAPVLDTFEDRLAADPSVRVSQGPTWANRIRALLATATIPMRLMDICRALVAPGENPKTAAGGAFSALKSLEKAGTVKNVGGAYSLKVRG